MNGIFERIMFRLGYSRTEYLVNARTAILQHATRAHRYEELLFESERLTQRSMRMVEELRRVNKELALSWQRLQARGEFEMRVKRASGIGFSRSNEAG